MESNVSSEVVEEEQTGGIDGLVSSLTNQMDPPWELVVCIEEYKYENGMMVYDGMGEILLNATIKLDENKRIIKVEKGGMYGRKDGGAEIKAKIWFAIVKEPSPNSLSVEMYEAIEQYQSANGLLIGYSVSNAKEDDENVDEYTGKEIHLDDNGDVSHIMIRTVESGKWVLDEIFHSDGTYSEQHYDESENLVLFKWMHPNGDIMEERTEYDENGERTYMHRVSTGTYNAIQEYFCEDGKSKKDITQNLDEGTVSTTLYDENRMDMKMTTEYADGRKQVVIIEDDKVVRGTIYETDGRVVNYDAEGNVVGD